MRKTIAVLALAGFLIPGVAGAANIFEKVGTFDGQFLKEQDFIDEQRYHLDRQRRLTRLVLGAGVLEGLEVAPVSNAPRVKVAKGTRMTELELYNWDWSIEGVTGLQT